MRYEESGQRDRMWVFRRPGVGASLAGAIVSTGFLALCGLIMPELYAANMLSVEDDAGFLFLVLCGGSLALLFWALRRVWRVETLVIDPDGQRIHWAVKSPLRRRSKTLAFDEIRCVRVERIRHLDEDGRPYTTVDVSIRTEAGNAEWLVVAEEEGERSVSPLVSRIATLARARIEVVGYRAWRSR